MKKKKKNWKLSKRNCLFKPERNSMDNNIPQVAYKLDDLISELDMLLFQKYEMQFLDYYIEEYEVSNNKQNEQEMNSEYQNIPCHENEASGI